jgi:DNA-binding CsgD family transcriptional regulator
MQGSLHWIEPARLERIHALWDTIADFPAGQTDAALQHVLASLCELFEASSAAWAGATRDADGAWRTHGQRRVLAAQGYTLEVVKARSQMARDLTRHLERAGQGFRARRWLDFVEAEWFASADFHAHYGDRVRDAVYVGFPLGDACESTFIVLRGPDEPPFREEERDGIGYALRGIKRFHRHLMLSFGLIEASAKLTQTERKVLQQLLTGRTEKEVAAELALSYHTTHAHVAAILKKFGANNRPSLMSRWVT